MNVVRGWRRDEPLERRQQRVEGRHARRVGVVVGPRRPEMPVRVGVELLPALVRRVERLEERHRIGDVDDDRDPELRGGRPQRVEPRVVDGDQPAVRVACAKPERLPDLEPAGAAGDGVPQRAPPPSRRTRHRSPSRRSRGRRRRSRDRGRPTAIGRSRPRAPRPGRRRGRRSPRRRTRRGWRPARPRTGPPTRRRTRRRGGCGRRPPGTSACRRGGPAPGATCAAGSRRGGASPSVIPGPGSRPGRDGGAHPGRSRGSARGSARARAPGGPGAAGGPPDAARRRSRLTSPAVPPASSASRASSHVVAPSRAASSTTATSSAAPGPADQPDDQRARLADARSGRGGTRAARTRSSGPGSSRSASGPTRRRSRTPGRRRGSTTRLQSVAPSRRPTAAAAVGLGPASGDLAEVRRQALVARDRSRPAAAAARACWRTSGSSRSPPRRHRARRA